MALPVSYPIGRLGQDPELRFTKSGKAVASFSLACNSSIRKPDGSYEDGATTWLRCTAWENVAENIAEQLNKGDLVMAEGRLESKSWKAQDGTTHERIEFTISTIAKVLTSKGSRSSSERPTDPWAAEFSDTEAPF